MKLSLIIILLTISLFSKEIEPLISNEDLNIVKFDKNSTFGIYASEVHLDTITEGVYSIGLIFSDLDKKHNFKCGVGYMREINYDIFLERDVSLIEDSSDGMLLFMKYSF